MNTKPIILTVPAFEDFRGYLAVPYDQSINFTVRQINQGYSKKAFTLRGLHFQEGFSDVKSLLRRSSDLRASRSAFVIPFGLRFGRCLRPIFSITL